MTALREESKCDLSVNDLLKDINIKDATYIVAESWSEVSKYTLMKSWRKLLTHIKEPQKEAVTTEKGTENSTKNFGYHSNVLVDAKIAMKTHSNGWLLTEIFNKKLCLMMTLLELSLTWLMMRIPTFMTS